MCGLQGYTMWYLGDRELVEEVELNVKSERNVDYRNGSVHGLVGQ